MLHDLQSCCMTFWLLHDFSYCRIQLTAIGDANHKVMVRELVGRWLESWSVGG
jgi:hypothetical protein